MRSDRAVPNPVGTAIPVSTDGTTTYARDVNGLIIATGGDAGAVISAILPAPGTVGREIVYADGSFGVATTPALPPNVTTKLRLRGSAGTRLVLATPRAFDPNKTANGDTFQNIEIDGLLIDANNLGGQHHILFGTYVNGTNTAFSRCSFTDLYIHDNRIVNALTDTNVGTNHRLGIHIVPTANLGDPIVNLKRIIVERNRQDGGNFFCTIGGLFTDGSATVGCPIYMDDVTIRHWYHDLGAVQNNSVNGFGHVQVGGRAYGGRCYVGHGWGRGSADVVVEINALTHATVEHVIGVDPGGNGFYHVNYNTPENANEQVVIWRDCEVRVLTSTSPSTRGWYLVDLAPLTRRGTMILENPHYYRKTANLGIAGEALNASSTAGGGFKKLIVRNPIFVMDGIAAGSGSTTSSHIDITALTISASVDIQGGTLMVAGNVTGATAVWSGIRVLSTFAAQVRIRDVDIDQNLVGNAAFTQTAIAISTSGQATNAKGTIENVRLLQMAGDTSASGISFRGTTLLTIPTGEDWRVLYCDLRAAAAGREILLVTDGAKQTQVYAAGNKYNTFPKASSTITVGASPFVYQNLDCHREIVIVRGGSTTKIELDDGQGTYRDLGVVAGAWPVDNAQQIRVTYPAAAPAMEKIPER